MKERKVVQKQGVVDEEGNYIVPLEYEKIQIIEGKVYIAFANGNIYFYSDKGKIMLTEEILDYKVYLEKPHNEYKFIGLKTSRGWHIVDLDLEKNIFVDYCGDLNEIETVYHDYVIGRRGVDESETIVFSLKEKRILFSSKNCESIEFEKRGFRVIYLNGLRSFYDYTGKEILSGKWNRIICHDEYIIVGKAFLGGMHFGVFSYDGKIIIPAENISLSGFDVVSNGKEIVLFRMQKENENSEILTALKTFDGKEIIRFEKISKLSIVGNNIIVQKQKMAELFLITHENEELCLKKVYEADKISALYAYEGELFKIKTKHKVGIIDCYGKVHISPKYRDVFTNLGNNITVETLFGRKFEIDIPYNKYNGMY